MKAENVTDFDQKFRTIFGGKSRVEGDAEDEPKSTVVEKTLEILAPFIRERWHTPSREAMLTMRRPDGIDLHMALSSSETTEYLAYLHYQATKKPISEATQKAVVGLLSAQARYEGQEHPVYSRIAHVDGKIYVDMGDDLHCATCIDPALLPTGWKVIGSGDVPVRFRRSRSALPLPAPVSGVSLDGLRVIFPNIEDADWIQVVGWLVGCFQEYGGRAFLELLGGQGTGKSTLGRYLISLVDPNDVPMRSMPKNEQDLLISVLWRSVAGLDNLSVILAEMADAFCRISTGAGISNRTLFKDAEETLLKAQLPLLWTAIEPQAVRRADLQDRTITVRLESLGDDAVRGEREIAEAFEDIRPDLLGALYTAVAVALSRVDTMTIDRLPRLDDFATWVEASAPAFGWDEGAFIDVLESSRTEASAMAIEASPIGPLIVAFMKDRTHWNGTSSKLLSDLRTLADEDTRRSRSFPKDASRLSGQLRRMVQPLKAVGIRVEFDRSGRSRGCLLYTSPSPRDS